jgi:hypothetical protein
MARKLKRPRYVAEFNRALGDSISRVVRRLERLGYVVERLPHLTTLRIWRPKGGSFAEFLDDLRALLHPRRGGVVLNSSTGRAWLCSMRGNRPGDFVRI